MKKEINKNFRVDEDFEAWLGRLMMDLDCNLSELIRASLLLSAGQLRDNPSLLRMVTLEQLKSQQNCRKYGNGNP